MVKMKHYEVIGSDKDENGKLKSVCVRGYVKDTPDLLDCIMTRHPELRQCSSQIQFKMW